MSEYKVETHRIYGDCLEAIGIPSSGTAVIAIGEPPQVFDVVWCEGVIGGEIGGYLKQIVQTGAKSIVRTQYLDTKRNYMFAPCSILGVVLEVYNDAGNTVWKRTPAVEAESVRHGRWIYENSLAGINAYHCSECNRLEVARDLDDIYETCPYCNCGAKMYGGAE